MSAPALSAGGHRRFDAVLFDRDGTLVRDVPYNGDPERVDPVPGARRAVARLRAAGYRLGVVSNQSGVGRGLLTPDQVRRVDERIDELVGPFDTWQVCPHPAGAGCGCRKPAPGLVHRAAAALDTVPGRCVVIGDIGADVAAAVAAGATAVLVPTQATLVAEVAAAPAVCRDLAGAADWVLAREALLHPAVPAVEPGRRVLAVRADSAGDVLVTGPAIRALAARAGRLTLLCGPAGRAAARLLPGVDEIVEWPTPWIASPAMPVDPTAIGQITGEVRRRAVTDAVIFTSYHQSPLPMALLLRLAGVARIAAISDDYPGSLLDVRHRVPPGVPEAERALSLAAAAGYPVPDGDDTHLRTTPQPRTAARPRPAGPPRGPDLPDGPDPPGARGPVAGADLRAGRTAGTDPSRSTATGPDGVPAGRYVVVHPGAAVPARACPPDRAAAIVRALAGAGRTVVVTGGPADRDLTAQVAGGVATDLGGSTGLAELAGLIAGADAVVCGNTGPAHLAAAAGTPVVSLFSPTVPFGQWGPYRVPAVRLGDPLAGCRDTRATRCPVPGHPCLERVEPAEVLAAVDLLARETDLLTRKADLLTRERG